MTTSGHRSDCLLEISTRSFRLFQFSTVTILVMLGLFYYAYTDTYGDNIVGAIFEVFDVGNESSIPTYFSVFNLLLAGVLAFVIYYSRQDRRRAVGWLALSLLLLLLSIDEGAAIHERAGTRFLAFTALDIPLINDHRWLLAGGLLTAVTAPLFIPFLKSLDRRTAGLLFLSGAIFLGGALGLEFVGAWMMYEHGYVKSDFVYHARRVLEEAFEMYGIVLLNCTLLDYLSRDGIALTLKATETVTSGDLSAPRDARREELAVDRNLPGP